VTGTIEDLVVDNRVAGTTRRYHRLLRDDGAIAPLTGPESESLEDGAAVVLRGRQNGDAFAVEQVQQASPPAQGRVARSAALVQVEGTLAIAHADDFANGRSQYHYHVRDDAGGTTTLAVQSLPAELRGGSRVQVFGRRGADGVSLDPQTITVLAAPSGSGSGMVLKSGTINSVLVIMANFNNTAAPSYTAAQAQQVMVSNSDSVANYYNEVSYGGQLLNVTVTSTWVTMNLAATCDYTQINPAANTAALALNSTYNAANYAFVVYLFPSQSCGWSGLAYVGYPHQAFINGTGSFATQVVAHEMGHNFGLLHAGSLSCGSAAIGGSCSVAEYGDPWDTMGNQHAGHFNAVQKSILGWIPSTSVKTHSSGSASYTLSPLESAGGGTYAVKIPTTNANRTYWLEFRQPIGFDSLLATYPNNGVQVRVASPFEWASGADDTELVDMTPASSGGFGDSALVAGQSFLDSTTGVNIIVTSASASAVTVSVTKGAGTSPTTTTLASSVNPSTAGATVTLTATVTGTNPTGSVNFKDGSSSVAGCSAVAVSGSGNTRTAACATSSLSAGAHSLSAAYSGDSSNAASTSATLSQTVNKVASTTGIATSLTPSTVGTSVTFTATVSGSSPTGTVNFLDGGASISGCSAAAVGGSGNVRTATCATASLVVATHSITAAYSGDSNNNASTSAALSQVVTGSGSGSGSPPATLVNGSFETPSMPSSYKYNPTGTGIGWTFSANSGIQANGSAWGAARAPDGTQTAFVQRTGSMSQALSLNAGSYTLSFQVAQRSCCSASYVQPIKVTLDGVQIGSLVSPASTSFAAVSITFSVAATGAHTLAFAGTDPSDKTTFIDAVSLGSGSQSATTTSLASAANPLLVGTSVTFTASVTGSAPTGSVGFTADGAAISGCTAVALSGSGNTKTAQCITSSLAVGTHSIVATYSGDAANSSSVSNTLTQVVNAAPPATLVNASFETPALASGYQYNPSGAGVGWTFSTNSGVQHNGSAWGAAPAPDGTQTAFVQSKGSMGQTLNLNAGSYTLSFQVAQRSCCSASYVQPIKVTLDGVQIGSLVSPASTSFAAVSITFSVAASGAHTLGFAGTDSSDKTTFIDNVTIH